MARGSAVRGSRIGTGPVGESEQGVAVERVAVTFWTSFENHLAYVRDRRADADAEKILSEALAQPRDTGSVSRLRTAYLAAAP